MKKSSLKALGFGVALLFGGSVLSAQTTGSSTLAQKQNLAQQSSVNYDVMKASTTGAVQGPNKLVREVALENAIFYRIRLGKQLVDREAAKTLEVKLKKQPGVLSVRANHEQGTVEVTLKEEDEHNFLKSCFDID